MLRILTKSLLVVLIFSAFALAQTQPQLVIQTGHLKGIVAVAVSRDGKLIASGSEDQTIKIWDAETMRELRTFKGYEADYDSGTRDRLYFTPDGEILIAGDQKGITLWNVGTGARLNRFEKNYRPALSPDGRLLAMEESGAKILLRQFPNGNLVRELKVGWEELLNAHDMSFNADGTLLAVANEKGTRYFNTETGVLMRTIGPATPQFRIAFSSNGQLLVGATLNTLTVWDFATGRELRKMTLPIVIAKDTKQQFENKLYSITFSSDNQHLAVATLFGMQVWDATTGKLEREWGDDRMTVDRFDAAAFSSDGKTLVGGALPGSVYRWDVSSGRELSRSTTQTAQLEDVAFSPNGELMATEGGTTNIWNLAAGAVTQTHKGGYKSLFFMPDNQSLIRGFAGVDRLNLMTRETENLSAKGTGGFWQTNRAMAVSPNGEMIAGPGEIDLEGAKYDFSRVNKIQLVNAKTNQQVKLLDGHLGLQCVAFSPDGKSLASGAGDNKVKLWNVDNGKLLRTLATYPTDSFIGVRSVAFNHKGDLLATAGKTIQIWNVTDGSEVHRFDGIGNSVAFSPNGDLLAAAIENHVLVWQVASGTQLLELQGHTDKIDRVVFTPNGQTLATVSQDQTIKLWRSADGRLLATIVVTGKNDWLVVTPDGLFDGSPATWNQIQWRFSDHLADVAPVEWFFSDFYYPGLLAEIMAGRQPQANQNIAQKDRRQPQVSIAIGSTQTPAQPITERNVKLTLAITQAMAGAQDLRLFRNGSLVRVWSGDDLKNQSSATFETTVPIVSGENRFTAYAFNHDNVKSVDATLTVTGAAGLKRQGVAYVVAIGVNEYANPQYNLNYAVADARSFAEEFKRAQDALKNYSAVNVTILENQNSTKASILKALSDVASKIEPEDAVVIYFAGHGTAQQSRFYLVPHDLGYNGSRTELTRAGLESILTHSISDEEIQHAVEGIDAGQLLLVIDACNSGQALEAEEKRRGPMNSRGLAQLAYEKGMYILTAAQSYQSAIETQQHGHGYLTYALVEEGLKTPAADLEPRNGEVSVREWLDYATRRVPELQREDTKSDIDALRQLERDKPKSSAPPPASSPPRENSLQQPRVFYRRELEMTPLIVAKPK